MEGQNWLCRKSKQKLAVKLSPIKTELSLWRILAWPDSLRWPQAGTFGTNQSKSWAAVIFAHGGMEVSGSHVLRLWLMISPFHEQAVAEAAEQAHYEDAGRETNSAPVVVV